MNHRRFFLLGAAAALIAACADKFRTYRGPKVTRILVYKSTRNMYLLHNKEVLKSYSFGLGFAPVGHKEIEGDGKTPEGHYYIDRKNPNSAFYLSIGLSYPNARDVANARALGKSPGGDIFIHGTPSKYENRGRDWTWGCLAVTNKEMREIYAMIEVGTPITLYP